jgi:hypothetical protein
MAGGSPCQGLPPKRGTRVNHDQRAPRLIYVGAGGESIECRRYSTVRGAKKAAKDRGSRVCILALPQGGFGWFSEGAPRPRGAKVVSEWIRLEWVDR